jgi:hypothetical protein
VTGVASFVLLADISDQRLRTLHLNLQGGDQRVFRVNDNLARFPLNLKPTANCTCVLSCFQQKDSTIQLQV